MNRPTWFLPGLECSRAMRDLRNRPCICGHTYAKHPEFKGDCRRCPCPEFVKAEGYTTNDIAERALWDIRRDLLDVVPPLSGDALRALSTAGASPDRLGQCERREEGTAVSADRRVRP